METPHWIVRQKGVVRYEISCSECGYSFEAHRIIAPAKCKACGTVICDQDMLYTYKEGQLIREPCDDIGQYRADHKHDDIPNDLPAFRFPFFRRLRKIISAGWRKRD